MVDIYIDIEWLTKYNNLYEIKLSSNYLDASAFFLHHFINSQLHIWICNSA